MPAPLPRADAAPQRQRFKLQAEMRQRSRSRSEAELLQRLALRVSSGVKPRPGDQLAQHGLGRIAQRLLRLLDSKR